MNRSETKLLVENWRKVLNEGLHEEEVFLNEGAIKNALIGLAFSVPAFFSSGTANAIDHNDIVSSPAIESVYDNDSHFDKVTVDKAKDSINKAAQIIAFANNKETNDVEKLLLAKYDNHIEQTENDPGFTFTRASEDFFKDLNGYVKKCIKKINEKSNSSSDETGSRLDPDQQEKVDHLARLIEDWTKNPH